MNNVNQVTPYGSLTYDQSGSFDYADPNTGDVHKIPTYTATQTLSDGQQAIQDENERSTLNLATLGANQSGRLDGLLSRPLNMESLPQRGDASTIESPNMQQMGSGPNLQTNIGNSGNVQQSFEGGGPITMDYGTGPAEGRQRVEDALLGRMQPGLDRDRSAMETRLASQGIRMGSEAYSSAMNGLDQQANDARMSAILGAGREHSRLTDIAADRARFSNQAQAQQFGQNAQEAQFGNAAQNQNFKQLMTRAGFGNQANQQNYENEARATTANNNSALQEFGSEMSLLNAMNDTRNQAMQEQFALRNQPINEITALMSGSQVKNPNFVNPNSAQLANTDVAGITNSAHDAKMHNYQAKMKSWNDMMGGVGAIASILSDRRAKTDIKKVGKTDDGQNVYRYRYKTGGPMQLGLMAQEVEKKKPGAVIEVNGLKMVNYGEALT